MKTHSLLLVGALVFLAATAYAVTLRDSVGAQRARVTEVKVRRGEKAPAQAITWEASFEAALEKAKAENKLVMVDFHATWCGACRTLDGKTFTNAEVVDRSRRFVNVKVDVDREQSIAARYGVRKLPTVGWIRGDGEPIGGITGAYPPKYFVLAMEAAQKRADERAAKSEAAKSEAAKSEAAKSGVDKS